MSFRRSDIGKNEVVATGLDRAIPSPEENSSSVENEKITTPRQLDAAGLFLEQHRDLNVDDIDLAKLRHKIDRRVRVFLDHMD